MPSFSIVPIYLGFIAVLNHRTKNPERAVAIIRKHAIVSCLLLLRAQLGRAPKELQITNHRLIYTKEEMRVAEEASREITFCFTYNHSCDATQRAMSEY